MAVPFFRERRQGLVCLESVSVFRHDLNLREVMLRHRDMEEVVVAAGMMVAMVNEEEVVEWVEDPAGDTEEVRICL